MPYSLSQAIRDAGRASRRAFERNTRTPVRSQTSSGSTNYQRRQFERAISGASRDVAARERQEQGATSSPAPGSNRSNPLQQSTPTPSFEDQAATYGYTPSTPDPVTSSTTEDEDRDRDRGRGSSRGGSAIPTAAPVEQPAHGPVFKLPEIPLNLAHIAARFERERIDLRNRKAAIARAFELLEADLAEQEAKELERSKELAAGRGRIRSGLFVEEQADVVDRFFDARTRGRADKESRITPIEQALSTIDARRAAAEADRVREVAQQQLAIQAQLAQMGQLV